MKKIITILLTLLMVVSLGTVAFADTTVNVKIKNKGWISTSSTGNWTKELSVTQNTTIYLKAESYDDEKLIFNKWVIDNPNVDISGPDSNGIYSFEASGDCEIEQKGKYSYETDVKYYVRNVYVSENWNWNNTESFEHYTNIVVAEDTTSHQSVYIKSPKSNLEFPGQESFNTNDYEMDGELIRVNKYDNGNIGEVVEMVMHQDNTGKDPQNYTFENHPMGGGEDTFYYFSGSRENVLVTFVYTKKLPEGYHKVVMNGDKCTAKVNGSVVNRVKENEKLEISAPETIEVDGEKQVFSYWYCYLENRGPYYGFDVTNSTTTVTGINNKATFTPVYKTEGHTTAEYKSGVYFDGNLENSAYRTIGYVTGGVNGAGIGVQDRYLRTLDGNNTSYKLQKFELVGVDNNGKEVVLKTYTKEGMPVVGEVQGYYKRYQDSTIIPDGYKTIIHKTYYVSSAATNKTSSQILSNPGLVIEGKEGTTDLEKIIPTADISAPSEKEFENILNANSELASNEFAKVTDYYDLSLVATTANEKESYKISETGEAVDFTIYLSDDQVKELEGKEKINIVRVHGDETSIIPATLTGKKLTFSTDQFSTYAIVTYEKVDIGDGSDEINDKYKDLTQSKVLTYNNSIGTSNSEFNYLSVKPLGKAKVDSDNNISEMSFDVAPIDENGNKVSGLSSPIKFRLPVDSSVTYLYANIYHNGQFHGQSEIKSSSSGKYVEVEAKYFSEYSYVLTSTKYVAPSTNNPVNITRKPVVNTSAK